MSGTYGWVGVDNGSGDRSGVMTSIPWEFFNNWAGKEGIAPFDQLHSGVGMVFLPHDKDLSKHVHKRLMSVVSDMQKPK
ncbi:putative glutamate synthase (ferredoxin) [Helianthus annuus]|nr:putative glutamate synthase (ferredoxin) [Helianthus annuus]